MQDLVGRLDSPFPSVSVAAAPFVADRPRRPRPSMGPEGPWWRQPLRPQ